MGFNMKTPYSLGCYGTDAYVFSIPLEASTNWLKKTLRRNDLINGVPLRESQVKALRQKLPNDIEVGWHRELRYFLEG